MSREPRWYFTEENENIDMVEPAACKQQNLGTTRVSWIQRITENTKKAKTNTSAYTQEIEGCEIDLT